MFCGAAGPGCGMGRRGAALCPGAERLLYIQQNEEAKRTGRAGKKTKRAQGTKTEKGESRREKQKMKEAIRRARALCKRAGPLKRARNDVLWGELQKPCSPFLLF